MNKHLFLLLFIFSNILIIKCGVIQPIDKPYDVIQLKDDNLQCSLRVNPNRDQYITPDIRVKLCEGAFREFNKIEFEKDLNNECYKDDSNRATYLNPCRLECYEKNDDSNECRTKKRGHSYSFLITGYKCGSNHYCDDNGCCTAAPSIKTHIKPAPKPLKETTTVSTTTSDIFNCPSFGKFSDPNNESNYFECGYYTQVLECDFGYIFDENLNTCEPDWKQLIKCTRLGFFRNPYNCHRYYWCYHLENDPTVRLSFYNCPKDDIFVEELETCVPKDRVKKCDDLPIPKTYDNPLKIGYKEYNDKFKALYTKYIGCTTEGLFRNPYDCHKFYRCYYDDSTNDILLDIEFYVCKDDLLFDNKSRNCVKVDETDICLNTQIPDSNSIRYTLTY